MKRIFTQRNTRRLVLGMGAALLVAGSALGIDHLVGTKVKDAPPPVVEMDRTPVSRPSGAYTTFAPVVKKVAPAVVKVVVTSKPTNVSGPQGFSPDDPFWRFFFGDRFNNRTPNRQFTPPRQSGLGSGVIVTKDGYILTNNHVVDGADKVEVTLQDGRELSAKVVGRDPKSDIAVIKIEGDNFPFVTMADSEKVQVGDVVLAVGNPFGVGQTVTTGIVSATGRGNLGIEDYEDFIQTDAAINPGNSGGALVDAEGRLIGINTAIWSRTGGYQGIGFAIPSHLARDVMASLIQEGKVTRGYLGVMIQDVTPPLAKEFKLKEPSGALVGDVVPKGPAAKAGFKEGDVVVEFNGKKVPDARRLRLAVGAVKPGATVPVKILRNGSSRTLEVTVQQQPGTEQLAKASGPAEADNGTLNGVAVGDLDPQTRRQMNIPDTVKGAVITQVDPASPAAEAGLRPGDVIQELNRQPVQSAEQAVKMTEAPKDKITLLRIWSNGGSRFVVVDETKAG